MAGFRGLDELFEGRHFDREVIVLCVRWYLRFKLSYRDLVEMMAERGPTSWVIMACRRDLRELLHRIHKGPFNLGRLRQKTEVRPPSGTRYWQRNKIGIFEARAALQFKLHQNRIIDRHGADGTWQYAVAWP